MAIQEKNGGGGDDGHRPNTFTEMVGRDERRINVCDSDLCTMSRECIDDLWSVKWRN